MNDPQEFTAIPLARPVASPLATHTTHKHSMYLEPMSRGRAAANILLLMAAFVVLAVVLSTILIVATKPSNEITLDDINLDPTMALLGTLVSWVFLIAIGLLLLRDAKCPIQSVGLTLHKLAVNSALGLVVTATTFGAFRLTFEVMAVLLPEAAKQLEGNGQNIEKMLPDMNLAGMLALMICVAFCEEIVFRGFLLTHLRRLTGHWSIAIVTSSAIFASLHIWTQTPAVAIPLFVGAIVWSLFTIWRKSLWPAIIGHALFNFIQVMALNIISNHAGHG